MNGKKTCMYEKRPIYMQREIKRDLYKCKATLDMERPNHLHPWKETDTYEKRRKRKETNIYEKRPTYMK